MHMIRSLYDVFLIKVAKQKQKGVSLRYGNEEKCSKVGQHKNQ